MSTKPLQTILLVEDDENDVFFFQRAMNKAGMTHPLQVVRDGQEAISYLQGGGKFSHRAQVPPPGLILLDLKLPFVMGLDVLKWIRQQSGLAPVVIILSSSQQEADIAEAYRLGANAYLVKPAETSDLAEMVRAISDFWLRQNTPPPSPRMDRQPEIAKELNSNGARHQYPAATRSFIQVSI